MRLLFVHDRFGAMAGAEINAQLTGAELKDRGHDLGLLHGPPTGKGEDRWKTIFAERFPLDGASPAAATAEALARFHPDAVYIHKMSELPVLEALAKSGIPVVRMVHDHDLYCMRSYKYHPLSRSVCQKPAGMRCIFPCGAVLGRSRDGGFPLKWVSYREKKKEIHLNQKFQRLIVASEYMRQELLRNGFAGRNIEIHAPVPISETLAAQASFSARNLLIYSGQIIRGKGVDVLLESLRKVRAPFECLIFGDGNHRPYCENRCAELGLAGCVRFMGYVPPDRLKAYYAGASLAVVSSVWPEPFGAVGLEAMRHGLPVVAFDVGGIQEWLHHGENGFLVPWMNRDEFARRIEQLLADKRLARELGARGRFMAGEKFCFDRYIDGLENMFERVVSARDALVADPSHELCESPR